MHPSHGSIPAEPAAPCAARRPGPTQSALSFPAQAMPELPTSRAMNGRPAQRTPRRHRAVGGQIETPPCPAACPTTSETGRPRPPPLPANQPGVRYSIPCASRPHPARSPLCASIRSSTRPEFILHSPAPRRHAYAWNGPSRGRLSGHSTFNCPRHDPFVPDGTWIESRVGSEGLHLRRRHGLGAGASGQERASAPWSDRPPRPAPTPRHPPQPQRC
jgi:hypothetical protein